MADYLTRRGPFWYFQRWVPAEFREFDRRKIVEQSTKVRVVDDPHQRRAKHIAYTINAALETLWRELADGKAAGARQRYRQTILRARRLGYDYREMGEMIESRATLELVRRIEALEARGLIADPPALDALLGGVARPALMCSQIYDTYFEHKKADLRTKSKKQLEGWQHRNKVAIGQFVATLPADKPFAALTRADANRYREFWSARIVDQGYSAEGANTAIGYVASAIKVLARKFDLPQLGPLFAGLTFKKKKGQKRKRPAFSVEHIGKILAPGALEAADAELRRAILATIETGIRPAELVGLDGKTIHAFAKVPHISVEFREDEDDPRELKTTNSIRKIPLVGVALEAFRKQPNGFESYRDNSYKLAMDINKFLRKHGLMQTPQHTLYSFRHAFKDRLRAAGAGDELTDMLMGHSPDGPDYGDGYSLADKRKVLQRIALPVSAKLSV